MSGVWLCPGKLDCLDAGSGDKQALTTLEVIASYTHKLHNSLTREDRRSVLDLYSVC
jgi:hypothetical protein